MKLDAYNVMLSGALDRNAHTPTTYHACGQMNEVPIATIVTYPLHIEQVVAQDAVYIYTV